MAEERQLLLQNGLWEAGVRHDTAVLRPLTGVDEIAWAEAEVLPAVQATALLASAVQTIGTIAPVTRAHVRALTIGDRERLLLGLYAASFGRAVDTILSCPGCTETIELPLDLDELLDIAAALPPAEEHCIETGSLVLRFRLPNGADQEQAARMAVTKVEDGTAALRESCVLALSARDGCRLAPSQIPDSLQDAFEDALRRLDPAAEIVVAADCPACGERVKATLDAVSLLAGQLGAPGSVLADVDRLARTYHWSEAAILGLSTARRRRYLALLARAGMPA
jgi:hypothetical protein